MPDLTSPHLTLPYQVAPAELEALLCGWERIARQEVSSPYTPRSEGPFGAQFSRVEENAPAPRHSEQHPGSAAAIDELLTLFDSGTGPPQGPS